MGKHIPFAEIRLGKKSLGKSSWNGGKDGVKICLLTFQFEMATKNLGRNIKLAIKYTYQEFQKEMQVGDRDAGVFSLEMTYKVLELDREEKEAHSNTLWFVVIWHEKVCDLNHQTEEKEPTNETEEIPEEDYDIEAKRRWHFEKKM